MEAAGVPETPQPKTDVIFRKYRNGEIIALFPYEMEGQFCCMSYMHIGQHSGAIYSHCVKQTKPATSEEYRPLMSELISIGYELRVIAKISRK